ncbi:MAG: serine hydrolase domain-containing protein [Phenylobacterium sp.]|uniref:serine hydrolase domain-containing protein n=1 Tax=Phenylobacterium sp. TaxID=1871053 RepID=UPI0027339DDD|nr:serine hydrolase domain-containing protein [Phenylobacterium sp.]MDP3749121.1 serine hydrolase domain-containing protein [Phenylobacterium sp.]
MRALLTGLLMAVALAAPAVAQSAPDRTTAYAQLDPIFEKFATERHVPGLVFGVVVDGKLAYVKSMGVQDTAAKRPVTPDSVFRIASMSKNFTALAVLKLRDEGKLSLDAPAETLVPELEGLRYPTTDSPKIRVRDLLNHTGGFVTDDPWGDRQLPMSEADFSRFLRAGVPFSRPPAMAMEYSNFGYALAGQVVTNVSRRPYDAYIESRILRPLGMAASTYDVGKIPAEHRAIGYRWEDEAWVEEPTLGPGVFGAMGGLAVSANDYAKYVAWVLAAWPARDGTEDAILKRGSVREIAQGSNFPAVIPRSDKADPAACDRARVYGMGMIVLADCVLGPHFTHSGGLPGYGSNVLFLPERGLGVFAFANRTYAGAAPAVRDAAVLLVKSGAFPARTTPPSERLNEAAAIVAKIYAAGDVMAARDGLAMNVLLDSDAAHRNAELGMLKAELGACQPAPDIAAETAMSGTISYSCEKGRLQARVLLAPTTPVGLQAYTLAAAK